MVSIDGQVDETGAVLSLYRSPQGGIILNEAEALKKYTNRLGSPIL
jgi:hypothetical protein